jgi:hypothetical protein
MFQTIISDPILIFYLFFDLKADACNIISIHGKAKAILL